VAHLGANVEEQPVIVDTEHRSKDPTDHALSRLVFAPEFVISRPPGHHPAAISGP